MEKYQVIRFRRGVPCVVGEYNNRRPAKRYVDRVNRTLLIKYDAPLCRAFLLMRGGKLLHGPSAILG